MPALELELEEELEDFADPASGIGFFASAPTFSFAFP